MFRGLLLFFVLSTWSCGASSLKKDPMIQWALEHLKSNQDEDFVAIQSVKLAEIFAAQGNNAKARELLAQADSALKSKVNRINTTWPILPKLILAYLRLGDIEKAKVIMDSLKEPYYERQARLDFVRFHLVKGEFSKAMAHVEESSQIRMKIRGVGMIARASKGREDAKELLQTCKNMLYAWKDDFYFAPLQSLTNMQLYLLGEDGYSEDTLFEDFKNIKVPLRRCELILEYLKTKDLFEDADQRFLDLFHETQKLIIPLDLRIAILIQLSVLHDHWGHEKEMVQYMRRVILLLRQLPYFIYVDLGVQKMSEFTSQFRNYLVQAVTIASEYLREMRNRRRKRDFIVSLIPGFMHGAQVPSEKQDELMTKTFALYELCPVEFRHDALVSYIVGLQFLPEGFPQVPKMVDFIERRMKLPLEKAPEQTQEPSLVPTYYKNKDRSKPLFEQTGLDSAGRTRPESSLEVQTER